MVECKFNNSMLPYRYDLIKVIAETSNFVIVLVNDTRCNEIKICNYRKSNKQSYLHSIKQYISDCKSGVYFLDEINKAFLKSEYYKLFSILE